MIEMHKTFSLISIFITLPFGHKTKRDGEGEDIFVLRMISTLLNVGQSGQMCVKSKTA
jgi:hypothetical protein